MTLMPDGGLIGRTIGTYRVTAILGAGGMGEVYAAHDTNLDRPVAIKLLLAPVAADADRLRRFRAEARAISSLNHPHILVIYDFGELDGRPFIVTELVEGETLRQRIARGPLPIREAVEIAVQATSALAAAHARGIVHRDIKPENVMLRPDGYVKVLDFGLAKLQTRGAVAEAELTIAQTTPGLVLGTPRYMSPEQARGLDVDERTDVWSVGVILYEMVAGRAPFAGATSADVMAAILTREPEPVTSHAGHRFGLLDATVTRALAKDAGDRYASAQELHKALTAVRTMLDAGVDSVASSAVVPGGHTRLIVLPFRMLKPDPDLDFLAFSLPDALTATLSGLESVVVRSSLVAARFAGDAPDLPRIAREAGVDLVVTGTLLRAGDQLRVVAQLADAAAGTVVWSHTAQAPVDDLFRLQDSLVERIAGSLSRPLTDRDERQLRRDVPATPKAYEYYLRANEAARQSVQDGALWTVARDLYLQSIDEDPRYAPAWTQLARVYRLLGKYRTEDADANLARAEDALKRALALNRDLSMAHNLYAHIEIDRGRAADAMVRLLERARDRGGDAEIFAGLVQACRYCGLLEASVAAHVQAQRRDPALATSVMHTYFVMRRYDEAVTCSGALRGFVFALSLDGLGRRAEALTLLAQLEKQAHRVAPELLAAARTFIEGKREECLAALDVMETREADPESRFYHGRLYAALGEGEKALATLARSLDGGYVCDEPLAADPAFDTIRADPRFHTLRDRARAARDRALDAFLGAQGPRILELPLRK